MKKVIIVYDNESGIDKTWSVSLKKDLCKCNIGVSELSLKKSTYDVWKKKFDTLLEDINEGATIITHGECSNIFVRYVVESKCKVNSFISLASSCDNKVDVTEVERKNFSSLVKYRYSIYSNMDDKCSEKELEKFALDIKANRSVYGFIGHLDASSKIMDVPFIIDIVKEIRAKNRKNIGRVVYVGIENKVGDATIKKYKEVKEYLTSKFRYVTTPLNSIEHIGVEKHKFKKYTDLIKESEFVILDIHPDSIEVGVEMMMAISMQKPTLVVAKSSIVIPDIVKCAYDEKDIKRYRNTEQLIEIIGEYIDE